jgi:hypothetical protein
MNYVKIMADNTKPYWVKLADIFIYESECTSRASSGMFEHEADLYWRRPRFFFLLVGAVIVVEGCVHTCSGLVDTDYFYGPYVKFSYKEPILLFKDLSIPFV